METQLIENFSQSKMLRASFAPASHQLRFTPDSRQLRASFAPASRQLRISFAPSSHQLSF
jgi:hypothetical protein